MKKFKAGQYQNNGSYRSFQPSLIDREWLLEDMEILQLLNQADRQMGRLDMYSEYIPNIDLFISMHIVKEATKSNKIEGTQTKMEEALLDRDDIHEERRRDWEEVQNYIEALNESVVSLKDIPFSTRLIKKAHSTLLKGVRGKHKLPGEFRTSQNWIGGASIQDATFIPPHPDTIHSYMSDLEKYTHNKTYYFPHLLKIALIHYQFETIHPFLDGNGRVGRLMITLYLVEKGILKKPILYLSDFFERNRNLYYNNLMKVRNHDNLKQWFKFFLVGVNETAKNSIETFDGILKLKKETENKIQEMGNRARNAMRVLDYLFIRPIVGVKKVGEITEQSTPSAYTLIKEMEKRDILNEITGKRRNKRYLFKKYLNLFAD